MYKTITQLLGILLLVGGLIFAVHLIEPRSDIWNTHLFINIKTGQCRVTRMICFVPVNQQVDNTVFSEALKGKIIEVRPDIEPWQKASTFSSSTSDSLNYLFDNYYGQARAVEYLFERANYSDDEKQKVAATVLSLWQQNGRCSEAGNYIEGLLDSIPDE